jgi:hypothetical protein
MNKFVFVISAFAGGLAFSTVGAAAPCGPWYNLFWPPNGSQFPDTYVTYWRMPIASPKGDSRAFQMTAAFPHGRFSSVAVYDRATGQSLGELKDVDLVPDAGSTNPFDPTASRAAEHRGFTVWLAPAGGGLPGAHNLLTLPPADQDRVYDLWFRVYLPDADTDATGGVPLPTVTAHDASSLAETDCGASPGPDLPVNTQAFTRIPLRDAPNMIAMHVPDGGTDWFSERGESYQATWLTFTDQTPVAVVRFKAPRTPLTYSGDPDAFHAASDARYWSMCLSGLSTHTSGCLADVDARIGADGMVTLVIGDESLQQDVLARGLNFLPRGSLFGPMLIYRKLLAAAGLPSASDPGSPTGRYYATAEFLSAFPLAASPAGAGISHSTPSVPPPPPPPTTGPTDDGPTLRLGVSLSFIAGYEWPSIVTRTLAVNPDNFAAMAADLSKQVRQAFGFGLDVKILSIDALAAELDAGDLDFVFIPGEEYQWLERVNPALEPLVFGTNGPEMQPSVHGNLMVAKAWLDARPQAVRAGRPLSALQGRTLAVAPARTFDFFSTSRILTGAGYSPDGFFKPPQSLRDNEEDALDDLVFPDPSSGLTTGVALVDDYALERFRGRKPGVFAKLAVYMQLPEAPAAMIAYNPYRVNPALEDALTAMVGDRPLRWPDDDDNTDPATAARDDLASMLIGHAAGTAYFRVVNQDYADVLARHLKAMGERRENDLPFLLFSGYPKTPATQEH